MKDAIYFPILRGRRGEINAVAGLRSNTKVVVRPMSDVPLAIHGLVFRSSNFTLSLRTASSIRAAFWSLGTRFV
jgi:hypothetical protein